MCLGTLSTCIKTGTLFTCSETGTLSTYSKTCTLSTCSETGTSLFAPRQASHPLAQRQALHPLALTLLRQTSLLYLRILNVWNQNIVYVHCHVYCSKTATCIDKDCKLVRESRQYVSAGAYIELHIGYRGHATSRYIIVPSFLCHPYIGSHYIV